MTRKRNITRSPSKMEESTVALAVVIVGVCVEIFLNVDGVLFIVSFNMPTCALWLLLSCMFTDLCNRAKAENVYQGLSGDLK